LKRFAEVLEEKGVEVRLNSPVGKIEKLENGRIEVFTSKAQKRSENKIKQTVQAGNVAFNLRQTNGSTTPNEFSGATTNDKNQFDKVILTCPPNIAAKVLPQLTDNEKQKLDNIRYLGIVCASLLTKKSISEYYVTNITDETPFTGIIELSALVDKKEFGGNALIYLPRYVLPDDELFEKTDEEIEEIYLGALEKMYAHFDREDIIEFKISRVRRVFPLLTLNYSKEVPAAKTSIEGVFTVNSAQITNGTLNINETVQLAEKFFEENFLTEKN